MRSKCLLGQQVKDPGQGFNTHCSCNLCHSCGNAGSLTHCTIWEVPILAIIVRDISFIFSNLYSRYMGFFVAFLFCFTKMGIHLDQYYLLTIFLIWCLVQKLLNIIMCQRETSLLFLFFNLKFFFWHHPITCRSLQVRDWTHATAAIRTTAVTTLEL